MPWVLYALISAVLTAGVSIVAKKMLRHEHAMEFSANVNILCAILSIPLLFFIDYSTIHLDVIILLFFACILGSIAYYLVSRSEKHMAVSDTSALLVLSPGLTAVLAFLFLREALSGRQVFGIALLVVGAFILELKSKGWVEPFKQFAKSKYIHYILIAMLLYAVTAIADRYMISDRGFDPIGYVVVAQFFSSIVFVVMMTIFHGGIKEIMAGFKRQGWWHLLEALMTVGHRLTFAAAIQIAYVGLAISIKRTSALFATIIGGEIFHEHNLGRKILACTIMVLGAVLVVV